MCRVLWFLRRRKIIRESCYKLMLFMGLISMVNIHSGCLLIGIYAIRGDVFSFYTCESIVSVILALNRCIEMINHRLAVALFDGAKVYIWIGASIVYGLFMGFMFIPPIANGMMVGFFWQAHIGYVEDTEGWYQQILFPIHNFFIGFSIPIIYLILYFMLRKKSMNIVSSTEQRQQPNSERKRNKKIFIQVMLIVHGSSYSHFFHGLLLKDYSHS
uniref:7TM_GPCR_Srx domain-containing protein n=1 Tax=Globodera pallida TaxID=36090 RepID=A0A183CIU0_GLOPA